MLIAMDDDDYRWISGTAAGRPSLRVVEGGIAPPEIIEMLRGVHAGLAVTTKHALAWMIVEEGEAIGMINLVARDPEGRFELGYGVASAHHRRGVMTRAIAELLPILAALGLDAVTANTATDNPASQRVLERNGFRRSGTRIDPEDGALICWTVTLG